MAMMRTSNPALNDQAFSSARSYASGESMTIQGTVNKTFVLLGLLLLTASWIWNKVLQAPTVFDQASQPAVAAVGGYVMVGLIAGLVFGFVTIFKKEWSAVTAPLYALAEGLVLGGISALMEREFAGIVIQAVALTCGTLLCLLLAYQSRLIQATENFKLGVVAATGGIAVIYLVTWLLSFFNVHVPYIHDSGPLGIGFSVVVVVIAALNLVLDFDFIEKGSQQGTPKYMEWYGAFGLMVTLVWLYLEILRLLVKMRERK